MKFKYLAIALVAPFLLACQQLVEDVPASSPTVSFERESLNVQAAASEMTVNLTANCDWTISSGADWLQVTPLSGTRATTSVTLSVSENTVEDTPRSGELTLTAKGVTATIKINQAAPVGPIPPGTAIYTVEDFKTFLQWRIRWPGPQYLQLQGGGRCRYAGSLPEQLRYHQECDLRFQGWQEL